MICLDGPFISLFGWYCIIFSWCYFIYCVIKHLRDKHKKAARKKAIEENIRKSREQSH